MNKHTVPSLPEPQQSSSSDVIVAGPDVIAAGPHLTPMPDHNDKHETSLECAGSYYSWACTCGKTSRHLLPLHRADRNARAHVRKAKRVLLKAPAP